MMARLNGGNQLIWVNSNLLTTMANDIRGAKVSLSPVNRSSVDTLLRLTESGVMLHLR
jgi:hypothetical protein